jgi:hypothetical protein
MVSKTIVAIMKSEFIIVSQKCSQFPLLQQCGPTVTTGQAGCLFLKQSATDG